MKRIFALGLLSLHIFWIVSCFIHFPADKVSMVFWLTVLFIIGFIVISLYKYNNEVDPDSKKEMSELISEFLSGTLLFLIFGIVTAIAGQFVLVLLNIIIAICYFAFLMAVVVVINKCFDKRWHSWGLQFKIGPSFYLIKKNLLNQNFFWVLVCFFIKKKKGWRAAPP